MRKLLLLVLVLLWAWPCTLGAQDTIDQVNLWCGTFTNDVNCIVAPQEDNVFYGPELPGCYCGSGVVQSIDLGTTNCALPVDVKAQCVYSGMQTVRVLSGDIGILQELQVLWEPGICGPGTTGNRMRYRWADVTQYNYGHGVDATGRPKQRVFVRTTHVRSLDYLGDCTP